MILMLVIQKGELGKRKSIPNLSFLGVYYHFEQNLPTMASPFLSNLNGLLHVRNASGSFSRWLLITRERVRRSTFLQQ